MTRRSSVAPVAATAPGDLSEALDMLLELALSLDPSDSPEKLAERCLARGQALLPNVALGLCVVNSETQTQFTRTCIPSGMRAIGQDPTRLFPNFAHEWVHELDGALPGSSFHMASDTAPLEPESWERRIAERLSQIVAVAIGQALKRDNTPSSDVQLRALKAQLLQAEKLASLGQVVAGVVHELANPLTSIVAYSDYLTNKGRREGADKSDLERLTRIGESAERMLNFTRDLVAYARPADTTKRIVDVHDVIRKAVVFCEHELTSSGARVHLDLMSSSPHVRGTDSQLVQVFVNLLTNAAHAMRKSGGLVSISTRPERRGSAVAVRIMDQGVGIPQQVLPKIFDPFFSTKAENEGTGLGLAIVHEIVIGHEGVVRAESTQGEGSTFIIELPTGGH